MDNNFNRPGRREDHARPAKRIQPIRRTNKPAPDTEHTVIFDAPPAENAETAAKKDDTIKMEPVAQRRSRSIFKPREKKPNFILSIILLVIKFAFIAVFVAIAVGFGTIVGVAKAYLETTPELDTGKIEDQNLTSYIYDQQGNLLATYSGKENRDWAPLSEIPEDLQNAVIAVEDIRFWTHEGVDMRRLVGAFVSNLSSSKVEGGSTITQQLIKNKLLTSEKSYKRKLQEAFLATELEKNYTKEEILEAYLNSIPLGGHVYGVKTAAKDYFGKELSQLNLKEMVCIAAITQSTTKFNPRRATYVNPADLPYLINRMNIITERMKWNNLITEEQFNQTFIPSSEYLAPESNPGEDGEEKELILKPGFLDKWKEDMKILEESPANSMYKYPHFVEYVIEDVQNFMLKQQGLEDTEENRAIVDREMRAGGYKIYATIDTEIQDIVQTSLEEWDRYPDFDNAANNIKYSKDNNGNPIEIIQPQAAAVVIENETGYLRAIVGSRNKPETMLTFNRAASKSARLQIGSSIKPIAVYGPAFDTGYGLASSVANIPVPITGWAVSDDDPGYPKTSHGEYGPVSMHNAIVQSLNIAAARTQADYVGVDTSLAYLEALGVDTSKFYDANTGRDNRGIVGLALGAAPITPIELTGAYATIARGGTFLQPVSFSEVLDSQDNLIINSKEAREEHVAFKPTTAWMLTKALEDAVDHGTGTRAKIEGMTTAGKTGTVVLRKGACFTGFTPYYTSALWLGHDDYKPFSTGDGGRIAAPLWNDYMTKIHEGLSDKPINAADPQTIGLVEATLCAYSNMKPTSLCSQTSTDWIAAADVPTVDCTVCGGGSGAQKICTASGLLFGAYCPAENAEYRGGSGFPANSPYSMWSGGGSSSSKQIIDPVTGKIRHVPTWWEEGMSDTERGSGASTLTEYCNVHTGEWYQQQQQEPIPWLGTPTDTPQTYVGPDTQYYDPNAYAQQFAQPAY